MRDKPEISFLSSNNNFNKVNLEELTLKIGSGKTPKGGDANYQKSGIVLIRSQNIYNNKVNFKNIAYISPDVDATMINSRVLKGDVLLNITGASIGRSAVYKEEKLANVNQHVCIIRPTSKLDPYYLQLLLASEIGQKQISISQAGGGKEGLNFKQIAKMSFLIPSIEVQKKIGIFFTNFDETIALHQQELDALKQTKQGFLQKMFPKDQELIPKMRLSGFKGKWIEMKFKNLAKIRRGLTYKPKDVDKSGVRVLRSSNIKSDSFILKDDDVFVKQEVVNINYAKENEILITSANGSSNLVGKHALIKKLNSPTVHGGFMLIASAKTPYFVNTLMNTEWYDRFIKVHVSGGNGAIGNLNKNSLENYSVIVPSIEEQVKIGEFFRQLDEVIELKEQELEALNQTKKGFLQKMFV